MELKEPSTQGFPVTTRLKDVEARDWTRRLIETNYVFAEASEEDLASLGSIQLLDLEKGLRLEQEADDLGFYALLEGKAKVYIPDTKILYVFQSGDSFGEIPILGNRRRAAVLYTLEASVLLRFNETKFWQLMFACPSVRSKVLGNTARRLDAYQAQEVHREKLTSLGTLAAGLMHELKNPGAAAIRAASQMRENLKRLQQLSLKLTRDHKKPEQIECLSRLQERALSAVCCRAMSSLEQLDAEQALEEQLDRSGVENGWRLAPTLVSMGMTSQELDCAQAVFSGQEFSDSLNWLESLMSSVQLVGTIEESLGRVQDLIMAVKHYAYEDDGSKQTIDLHASFQSTLVILGHKLRQKEITVEREFAPDLPQLKLRGGGLNQVWTNLMDNAIDASPQGGTIVVRTWLDGDEMALSIEDHGAGISAADAKRVYEPFFTTKAAGVGSGLGLDIVRRILETKLGGSVNFTSEPGKTVFTVRLPASKPAEMLAQ